MTKTSKAIIFGTASFAEVVDFYQRAVEAEPDLMQARLKLVRALRRAERSQEALAHSEYLVTVCFTPS